MDPAPEPPPAAERAKSGGACYLVTAVVLAALLASIPGISSYREHLRFRTAEKAVQGNLRALGAALDQWRFEKSESLFVRYQDVYGPTSYVKAVNPVRGEDYHQLFPYFLPDAQYPLSIRLPGGRLVTDLNSKPAAPPTPPDGLRAETTPQGAKFEFTWRGGVRHGPMRAWRADGTLWCEAVFDGGRVVSAIHVTRDGRRFDELKGEAPP